MRELVKKIVLAAIWFYQAAASVFRPRCRFVPSCSEYARQAVAGQGAAAGLRLALGRILRCRPWGGYGYDPVK